MVVTKCYLFVYRFIILDYSSYFMAQKERGEAFQMETDVSDCIDMCLFGGACFMKHKVSLCNVLIHLEKLIWME